MVMRNVTKHARSIDGEKVNKVDLLVLTSVDHLLLILDTVLLFSKHVTSMRRLTVLKLPLQLGFPGPSIVESDTPIEEDQL